jgi:FtsZ-interacting cell division protein ZipA
MRPATATGNPVPVFYGPKPKVEEIAEQKVAPRTDSYAELKRQTLDSQASANEGSNHTAMTSQAVATPAAATKPAQYQDTAVSQYGDPQPQTQTVAGNEELPPVLTPGEYYARQLAHDAQAVQAQATQISTQGSQGYRHTPTHPSMQTFQPKPQSTTQHTGQEAAASQAETQQADARGGILPSLKFPSMPSWLKR